MRKDFAKVLCEEPRHGWRLKHVPRIEDFFTEDEMPVKVKMKPIGATKNFGEHLGPLKRFIRSRIGFRWDDVYSEISEAFPKKSATLIHIYMHLWQYVAKDCYKGEDGAIHTALRWGTTLEVNTHFFIVYIDEHGYLRPAPQPEAVKKPKDETPRAVEENGKLFVTLSAMRYRVEVSDAKEKLNPKWTHIALPHLYKSRFITRLIQQKPSSNEKA